MQVPLSKEQLKIVRTALTHFDKENEYGYLMQVIEILNVLTAVEMKGDRND